MTLRIGLRTRIAALCCFVVLAAIGLCEIYVSSRLERDFLDRMRSDLLVRLELVEREASSTTKSMDDFTPWDDLADDFALRSMTWVTLARPDGTVLGDSKLPDARLGSKLDLRASSELADALAHGFGESQRFSDVMEEKTMFVAAPFRMEDVVVGVVRVGVPVAYFDTAVQPIRRVLLVAWALALVAALLLALPAAHLITNRLSKITAAARCMAEGKLDTRTAVSGRDEVGELARVLDSMAARLGATLAALRKLEASRRELVANASHELRTPLAAICAASETLVAGDVDPETSREFIAAIDESARRLRKLVDDLLDLSRLDAGRFPVHAKQVETAPIIGDVVRSFRGGAEARDVTLSTEIGEHADALYADPDALAHVLRNFVDNAIKYCTPGTEVRVRAKRDGSFVVLSVEDAGPGIEPEHVASLFDRFYRADTSRSRETGGSGLGLAIAKQLVELMGGEIGVTSTQEGSRFWFSVPADQSSTKRNVAS